MSALVAADVSYLSSGRSNAASVEDNSTRNKNLKISFGDGVKTYPAGGIPLSGLSGWGFPHQVADVMLTDAANGNAYIYKWDAVNNKLRIYYGTASHTHDLLLKNAAVADGATTRVNAGANLLGANTGGDLTVTGGGANGGVVAVAASAGAEVSTSFAPAATVLYAYVRGY